MAKKEKKEKKAAAPKKAADVYEKPKKTETWKYASAAGAALFAMMMVSGGSSNVLNYVSVGDEAGLRKIFFSGEVWGVACHSVNSTKPLTENFEAVAHRLQGEMQFAVLDCKAPLPGSGKTTMKRWKLKTAPEGGPVLFVSNGVDVTQIPSSAARSEYDLVREFRLAAMRRPFGIKNTELLRDKCLYKPRCLLVLKGGSELEPGAEKALDVLAGLHANGGKARQEAGTSVAIAAIDSQDLKLSFEGYDDGEAIKLRRFEALSHRVIYFRNTSTQLLALAHKGPLNEPSLTSFLEAVSHDSDAAPFKRLVQLPNPVTLGKRAAKKAPKKKAPKKDPKVIKAEPIAPKAGETLTPEDRERMLKEQRDRESARREQMEQEAADSAYVVSEAEDDEEEPDHYADDDVDDVEEI